MMVSIILCTYNREKYLGRAINSILDQTYEDWELLVVDDGSTDHTEELVRAYTDPRIRFFGMERNRFYCYAANFGLSQCAGTYVAFQNSDDEWLPNKLEKQVRYMEEHPGTGACFTEVTLIDNEGRNISDKCQDMLRLFENHYEDQGEWMKFFLYYGNCVCHPSALVKRTVLEQAGGFNLLYCQLADFDLWARIAAQHPIHVLPEKLIRFRWDTAKKDQISSTTQMHTVRSFNEQMLIRKQIVERLTDSQMIRYFRDKFRNPESASHLELEFEKAFLLMDSVACTPELKVLGIEKLEEVLRAEGAVQVLEEHFGLTLQEVYACNQEHWYTDFMVRGRLEELAEAKKRIELCEAETENWRQMASEYKNSTSWKLTAPLRKAGEIARRIVKRDRIQ